MYTRANLGGGQITEGSYSEKRPQIITDMGGYEELYGSIGTTGRNHARSMETAIIRISRGMHRDVWRPIMLWVK